MARAKFKRYGGSENFTAFGGSTVRFSVEENVTAEMQRLIKDNPTVFRKALQSVGNKLRQRLAAVLRSGAAGWKELSKMHIYRRMDLLRAGELNASGEWGHGKRFYLKKRLGRSRVSGNDRLMDRWKGSTSFLRRRAAMGGKLVNAMRYKMTGATRVDIGALNPSASKALEAVQAGRRGSRGAYQFLGRQQITPAMRRAFWAAGIPLGKNKTMLEQPERPLVEPVYTAMRPGLMAHIEIKMREFIAAKGGA